MQVCAEQLQAAWHLVQYGSHAAGVDGVSLDLFSGVAEIQLEDIRRQLLRQSYLACPAKGFYLSKKSGGRRLIGIPTVRDRIVQRWVLQQIYPRLEQVFSDCAFAYRPGRSIYWAVERVMERYCDQPAWVIKADIQNFFDHLSWPLLLGQLERVGLRSFLLELIEQQLKSGLVIQGRFCRPNRGVLQGGVLSGALANLYLTQFDWNCLDAEIELVRYGDDCVAVCRSLIEASRALRLMQDWVEESYLSFHPEKTRIIPPGESFTFLGHSFCGGKVQAPGRKCSTEVRKPRAVPRVGYGPPKLCNITRTEKTVSPSLHEYWREGMTTLYISDQGAYLRVKNHQFQVYCRDELRCGVPANQVSHVVLFGCCNVSHGAVSLALRRRIPILYLATNGRYFGRLETSGQAKVEYLVRQVDCSQNVQFVRRQAEDLIRGKIHNCRVLLRRMNWKVKSEEVAGAVEKLGEVMEKLPLAESVESLLGYEGQAAHVYYQAFSKLLKGQFPFEKRTRRPPTDPVNSLLSLGYTLLWENVHAMLQAVGLHTHFGNLHTPRESHPALVSDLIEEFRACVVDAFVAYLINKNIFTEEDFTPPDERGGVYLFPDALKTFLKHWEARLQTLIVHPHTGYKVSYRRCMELQVWEYVSFLMSERDSYRPMRWEK